MNADGTYENIAERDAAIERIKAQCRTELELIKAHQTRRGHYFTAMPMWVDGVWSDYWYCTLDGRDVGDMLYDSFGSVIKGTALGELSYKAGRDAEIRAEEEEEARVNA